jgi:hypothetical protein
MTRTATAATTEAAVAGDRLPVSTVPALYMANRTAGPSM